MATKVIYFTIGCHDEQAEFTADDSADNVKEIFRVAAEAHERDIIKLYNVHGSLINISPKLPENSPETRYRLEVVGSHNNNEAFTLPAGFNLDELEVRMQSIERRILACSREAPEEVQEVKAKVEALREKLEGLDHLSWVGLYKDISQNSTLQPFWNKFTKKLKSPEKFEQVWAKVEEPSNDHISSEVCDYLRKLSFDNWQWDDADMILLLRQMFLDLNLLPVLKIEKPILTRWLFAIYKCYNDVPFHNFKHCFMVTQMMYGLIWLLDLKLKLDDVEIVILILSAICHDLDHPGYNNAYQINARTKLALLYNDVSPLENHHCSIAFEILCNKDVNILANVEGDVYKRIREGMIRCILATDMAKHNDILKSFRAVIPTFDWSAKEHRDLLIQIIVKLSDLHLCVRSPAVVSELTECMLAEHFNQYLECDGTMMILQGRDVIIQQGKFSTSMYLHNKLTMILIKMADISNEVRPMDVAVMWLECLLEEYFQQSDIEKLEGLPVAAFMDRDKVTRHSAQIGFIKFILLPLIEAIEELFPIIREDVMMPVQRALEYYLQLQKENELDKLVNDQKEQQALKKKDQDPENMEQANKFKVHRMHKTVSQLAPPKLSQE